jgi:hypothetical protein
MTGHTNILVFIPRVHHDILEQGSSEYKLEVRTDNRIEEVV